VNQNFKNVWLLNIRNQLKPTAFNTGEKHVQLLGAGFQQLSSHAHGYVAIWECTVGSVGLN
jgi:hypothetical protein